MINKTLFLLSPDDSKTIRSRRLLGLSQEDLLRAIQRNVAISIHEDDQELVLRLNKGFEPFDLFCRVRDV